MATESGHHRGVKHSLGPLRSLPSHHASKFVHGGAVMKDDNAPISAYGLHLNSVITLIPGASDPREPHGHGTFSVPV
ncbi:hypothetical protein FPV67DRAFT_1533065 [Lyophyllum atratum]|nr:hypothetical protein FPV67DRAFT_1533065 [Lyophyllum atratum]